MPPDPPRVYNCRAAMFSTSANDIAPRWKKLCMALFVNVVHIWMIYAHFLLYRTEKWMKSSKFGRFVPSKSGLFGTCSFVIQNWMFCIILIGFSEHACKSSRSGCFVQSNLDDSECVSMWSKSRCLVQSNFGWLYIFRTWMVFFFYNPKSGWFWTCL